jgi:hypothetical protein
VSILKKTAPNRRATSEAIVVLPLPAWPGKMIKVAVIVAIILAQEPRPYLSKEPISIRLPSGSAM